MCQERRADVYLALGKPSLYTFIYNILKATGILWLIFSPNGMANTSSEMFPNNKNEKHPSEEIAFLRTNVNSWKDDKEMEGSPSHLTWKGDPSRTKADWKIIITTNQARVATYNVHRRVVCFGPRQSKFLSRVATSSVPSNSKPQSAQPPAVVELAARDASNFPMLLDFIYSLNTPTTHSDDTVATAASSLSCPSLLSVPTDDENSVSGLEVVTTNNAVSLRYLAKRFEIESIMMVVNRFIQRDLNFETGPLYLSYASEYRDTRLQESAKRLCVENIEQINTIALLQLPVHLFRSVICSLECLDEENEDRSTLVSELVCQYFERHPDNLNTELLLSLTDSLIMPIISPEAAIGFTALIKELDVECAKNQWSSLVSLSRRCAHSVVQKYGWNDFSVNAAVDEYLGNIRSTKYGCSQLDSLLFSTSFAAALDQAQEDYEEILEEQETIQSIVGSLSGMVSFLEKSNNHKEKILRQQKQALDDALQQIEDLQQQLKEPKQTRRYRDYQNDVHLDEFSVSTPFRELVAPSQVGLDHHTSKTKKIKELRTKSEMRSKSLIK